MKSLLILMALLLLSLPASAADQWVNTPGASTQTFACDFQQSRTCWWDVTEAGSIDVTAVIDAETCENVTASWFANLASASHLNTAEVYDNGAGFAINASDFTAEKVKDNTLTGDPSGADAFSIYGFDANFIYARFTMNDVGSTGRLKIHCHPRPN